MSQGTNPQPPAQPPKVAVVRITEVDLSWRTVFRLTWKFAVASAVISMAVMIPVWINAAVNRWQEHRRMEEMREATRGGDAANKSLDRLLGPRPEDRAE